MQYRQQLSPTPPRERTRGRDDVRAAIGQRLLANAAIQHILRDTMQHAPLRTHDRARLILRRFFSAGAWSIEDDCSLGALVGPGRGWHQQKLGDDILIAYGWRGAAFRVECQWADTNVESLSVTPDASREHDEVNTPCDPARPELRAIESGIATLAPRAPRLELATTQLCDSFDGTIVPEITDDPRILRLLTGSNIGNVRSRWARRDAPTNTPKVAALFETIEPLTGVRTEPDCVYLEIERPQDWENWLGTTLAAATAISPIPRTQPVTNRTEQRQREELRGLDLRSIIGPQRIRDALNDRDPVLREIAVGAVQVTDPFGAPTVWRVAINDSARNVRRAAIRAIVEHANEDLRSLMERALRDADRCTRFHAVRGLAIIGSDRSRVALRHAMSDTDARVKICVVAALRGAIPPK